MTKTLRFGGSSDDTFGEITPRGDDYDNCASGEPIEYLVQDARNADLGVVVIGHYCPGENAAGWMVGVAPHDPHYIDVAPDWPMRLVLRTDYHGYALEIDAPDDAIVRCLTREANEE